MRSRWRWVLTAKTRSGKPYAETPEQAIDFFDRFFGYVAVSDFLTGRNGKWAGCTLAWLMNEANFAKVIEGNFDNAEQAVAA
ncbi:helix-turn-helix domain-containing protein [Ottowia pentelensis]